MNRAQAKRRSTAAAETLANRQAAASSRPGSPADAAERVASPQGAHGEAILAGAGRWLHQECQAETRRRESTVLSEMCVGRSGRTGRPVRYVRPVVHVQTLRGDVLRQPFNLMRCSPSPAERVEGLGFYGNVRDGQSDASQPGQTTRRFREQNNRRRSDRELAQPLQPACRGAQPRQVTPPASSFPSSRHPSDRSSAASRLHATSPLDSRRESGSARQPRPASIIPAQRTPDRRPVTG